MTPLEQVKSLSETVRNGLVECETLRQRLQARYAQINEALELINGLLTEEHDGEEWKDGPVE